MKKILLLVLLISCIRGYSQQAGRDTAWYVELKDSTILYSKKLSVVTPLSGDEYILLDNNKKIPMSQVLRYKSRAGEFIRDRGPLENYRLESGGPRLFIYSRSYYYYDSTGHREGRDYFFRKNGNEEMQKVNYRNLMDAVADNPASVRELKGARSTIEMAMFLGAVSFTTTLIGGIATFNANSRSHANNPAAKNSVSPALIIGSVMMVVSVAIPFAVHGRFDKAIRIYNQ